MTNKQFIKIAVLGTGVLSLLAAGIALVKVQAQVSTVQPFVAFQVEEMAPRKDQPPTPITRIQTIAVRSDGSISIVSKWEVKLPSRVVYSREVIDATAKTHTFVDDTTKTVVGTTYSDLQVLKPGVLCDGKPTEQVQGFDIVYSEHPMPGPDNDSLLTHKQWNAAKLGCYPVVQEFAGLIHGQPMDTKQTLASIKVGDPDPWYFEVPTNYTTRTTEEWMVLMKPLLKQ